MSARHVTERCRQDARLFTRGRAHSISIALDDPASLRASLYLPSASGGGLKLPSAGLAAPLLAAHFRCSGAVLVRPPAEFFVDPNYKTNPLDYQPTQQLLNFELAPA